MQHLITDETVKFIAQWEGFKSHAYWDETVRECKRLRGDLSARNLSNSTKGYACVISKNTGSFKVVTAYKGAPYNGGFTFQVIPAWDWS